ncbi:MAG TPA: N-acetylglucosamine-6-phosphate deacetylase [Acidimicrobiia bacterium]|nr:N-acetylglucosamine-6-phosphate deacetylase [Acidimicrobiia bacterium]
MTVKRLGVAGALIGSDLVVGDISIANGHIEAIGLSPRGTGLAIPGFVDPQVNGFAGVDFLTATPQEVAEAGAALARTGVVAYQPTLITSRLQDTVSAAGIIREAVGLGRGARIVGIHLEGPFLSPRRPGAHPPELLKSPDWEQIAPMLAAGPVTMVTLAPELPGAREVITRLVEGGVIVSLGHSDAKAQEADQGFDAGATAVTHLFNAMRPLSHRDPGIAGAALARSSIYLGVIVDGHHLADETIITIWRAAAERMVVVTDAIAATGQGDGTWKLGEVSVEVKDGVARRSDGTLAGSVGTMDSSFRNLLDLGIPLPDVVAATSHNARRLLGLPAGDLTKGAHADLVVVDDNYCVVRALIAGKERGEV